LIDIHNTNLRICNDVVKLIFGCESVIIGTARPGEGGALFMLLRWHKGFRLLHFICNNRKKRETETDKDAQKISEINKERNPQIRLQVS